MEFTPAKYEHLQITNKHTYVALLMLMHYMLYDYVYYTKRQLPLLA